MNPCDLSIFVNLLGSRQQAFQVCLFLSLQYYMYELLNDESNDTAQSPSAACPFAIVSFSYTDTKATPVASPEKRYCIVTTKHDSTLSNKLYKFLQIKNI